MTQVADPGSDPSRPSPDRPHDICPFLLADGGWRSAAPSREHRCHALGNDMPLALDKQARLCLTASHRGCPAYQAALGLDGDDPARRPAHVGRPYPRMAPVVLDHGRFGIGLPRAVGDRPAGQLALGALMVVAFAAIALARLTVGGDGGAALGTDPPSPRTTSAAAAPTPSPSPTPPPSQRPSPSPTQSPVVTPDPSPTPEPRTYKVKRGDTLIAIAARYGTTVRAIVDLNDIDDPARISIGTVLELPPEAP